MSTQRITAIVPVENVEQLETSLRECGVPGMTVERVQGYGGHPNFYRHDLMKDNVCLILYVDTTSVDRIIQAIVDCAKKHDASAGILAVESIDRLVNLTDGSDIDLERVDAGGAR